MKHFARSKVAGLILSALLLVSFAATAAPARPTSTPIEGGFSWSPWTNALPALGNHTNTSSRGDIIPVPALPARNYLAIGVTVTGGNIGTSNVVFRFNATTDNVNWTTDFPHTLTFPSNSTNRHRVIRIVGTNLPARYLRMDQMESPSTNSFTFTNWTYTFFQLP